MNLGPNFSIIHFEDNMNTNPPLHDSDALKDSLTVILRYCTTSGLRKPLSQNCSNRIYIFMSISASYVVIGMKVRRQEQRMILLLLFSMQVRPRNETAPVSIGNCKWNLQRPKITYTTTRKKQRQQQAGQFCASLLCRHFLYASFRPQSPSL